MGSCRILTHEHEGRWTLLAWTRSSTPQKLTPFFPVAEYWAPVKRRVHVLIFIIAQQQHKIAPQWLPIMMGKWQKTDESNSESRSIGIPYQFCDTSEQGNVLSSIQFLVWKARSHTQPTHTSLPSHKPWTIHSQITLAEANPKMAPEAIIQNTFCLIFCYLSLHTLS